MSAAPARNFTRLAIAIIIGAVVISASVLSYSTLEATVTSTSTTFSTTTSIATTTETQTQTTTMTSAVTSTDTTTMFRTTTATATSTTTSTVTSTYYPFVAPQLQVQLNGTTMRPGGAVMVTISLTNVLPYNLSFAPNYPSNLKIPYWDQFDFICGGGGSPIWNLAGYAVFQGHYSSSNVSSAGRPLTLIPPLFIGCPAWVNPDKVVFLPNSSRVVAYYPPGNVTAPTNEPPESEGEAAMNATTATCMRTSAGYISCGTTSLFGYWSGGGVSLISQSQDANTTSKYFNYFPVGQYTLIAEDIWGATTFSYFQVASS